MDEWEAPRSPEATLALPTPPETPPRQRGTWARVLAAVAAGSLLDAAIGVPAGLAISLGILLASASIAALARPARASLPFLAAGAVLGAGVSLRASSTLAFLDVAGAATLLAVGASFGAGGRPWCTSVRSFAARAFLAPFEVLPDAVAESVGPPRRLLSGRSSNVAAIVRLALIVVPVVLVLVALFASADPVFARLTRIPLRVDLTRMPRHGLVVAVGASLLAILLAMAGHASAIASGRPFRVRWATTAEWVSLLAVVDVVFGVFVVIQFAVFFGGQSRVLQEQGLTYAEYARSGFWQLLGAAAVAGGVLAFAWLAQTENPTPRARRAFLALGLGLVGLVLVVLVSAFQRLRLYERAYGYTPLRVLVHTTILAIAVLLLCTVVASVRGRASWLPLATAAVVTTAVLGLNVLNLDAFIARENLRLSAEGVELDVAALAALSTDAIPPMIEALPSLEASDRTRVEALLACEMTDLVQRSDEGGWAGGNVSRRTAREQLDALDLPPCDPRAWG